MLSLILLNYFYTLSLHVILYSENRRVFKGGRAGTHRNSFMLKNERCFLIDNEDLNNLESFLQINVELTDFSTLRIL